MSSRQAPAKRVLEPDGTTELEPGDVAVAASTVSPTREPKLELEIKEPSRAEQRVVVLGNECVFFGRSQVSLEKQCSDEVRRRAGAGVDRNVRFEILSSESVSSVHCKIWWEPAVRQFFVQDLKVRGKHGTAGWRMPTCFVFHRGFLRTNARAGVLLDSSHAMDLGSRQPRLRQRGSGFA